MGDPLGPLRQFLYDLEFGRIVRAEAKRTAFCHPDDAGRIRWFVDQSGLDDVVRVVESPLVPTGWMFLVDEQAIEAGFREDLRPRRASGWWACAPP